MSERLIDEETSTAYAAYIRSIGSPAAPLNTRNLVSRELSVAGRPPAGGASTTLQSSSAETHAQSDLGEGTNDSTLAKRDARQSMTAVSISSAISKSGNAEASGSAFTPSNTDASSCIDTLNHHREGSDRGRGGPGGYRGRSMRSGGLMPTRFLERDVAAESRAFLASGDARGERRRGKHNGGLRGLGRTAQGRFTSLDNAPSVDSPSDHLAPPPRHPLQAVPSSAIATQAVKRTISDVSVSVILDETPFSKKSKAAKTSKEMREVRRVKDASSAQIGPSEEVTQSTDADIVNNFELPSSGRLMSVSSSSGLISTPSTFAFSSPAGPPSPVSSFAVKRALPRSSKYSSLLLKDIERASTPCNVLPLAVKPSPVATASASGLGPPEEREKLPTAIKVNNTISEERMPGRYPAPDRKPAMNDTTSLHYKQDTSDSNQPDANPLTADAFISPVRSLLGEDTNLQTNNVDSKLDLILKGQQMLLERQQAIEDNVQAIRGEVEQLKALLRAATG
ncbi:hypothetical protein QFC22_005789 [Naganishia vaughanmartiniae]|uniref:Uncharacterized protein n=1 Tax=Naganishia vaughanmartiniae TaxID=1424756 RepID=A0ACC2WSE4_9TREE|nr:hypothetical protein QFC22_005789 [Naganishia vaughanmartiniae]